MNVLINGLASLAPSGITPPVRESGALVGLDVLDKAFVDAAKENAFLIGFAFQTQARSVGQQIGVRGNELFLRDPKGKGQTPNLRRTNNNEPWSTAAISAALAEIPVTIHSVASVTEAK